MPIYLEGTDVVEEVARAVDQAVVALETAVARPLALASADVPLARHVRPIPRRLEDLGDGDALVVEIALVGPGAGASDHDGMQRAFAKHIILFDFVQALH